MEPLEGGRERLGEDIVNIHSWLFCKDRCVGIEICSESNFPRNRKSGFKLKSASSTTVFFTEKSSGCIQLARPWFRSEFGVVCWL